MKQKCLLIANRIRRVDIFDTTLFLWTPYLPHAEVGGMSHNISTPFGLHTYQLVQLLNDGLLQANDGKMLVNDGEMLVNDGEMI